MQLTLDIPLARQERDKGIAKAESSANSASPGWSDRAFEMFKEWLSGWAPGHKFLMEDFRFTSKIMGLPDPPSERAFGGIALRARFAGLIRSFDKVQVKNKKAHACFATRWEKV